MEAHIGRQVLSAVALEFGMSDFGDTDPDFPVEWRGCERYGWHKIGTLDGEFYFFRDWKKVDVSGLNTAPSWRKRVESIPNVTHYGSIFCNPNSASVFMTQESTEASLFLDLALATCRVVHAQREMRAS